MKTIEIQNWRTTTYKTSELKVFVNDEKYILYHQIHKIQVDSNKNFRIRAKYLLQRSSEYTFEPKDDMVLQILVDQRYIIVYQVFLIIGITLNGIGSFLGKGNNFLHIICFLCFMVSVIFMLKKSLIIKEINSTSGLS